MATMGEFDARLYQGGFLLVSLVTAVLLAVVAHPGSLLGRAFGWAPLVWIGVRSYGIYLWHLFAVTFVIHVQGVKGSAALLPVLALTLALAAASWHLMEKPLMSTARRGSRSG